MHTKVIYRLNHFLHFLKEQWTMVLYWWSDENTTTCLNLHLCYSNGWHMFCNRNMMIFINIEISICLISECFSGGSCLSYNSIALVAYQKQIHFSKEKSKTSLDGNVYGSFRTSFTLMYARNKNQKKRLHPVSIFINRFTNEFSNNSRLKVI